MKSFSAIILSILFTILTEIHGLWIWDFGKMADTRHVLNQLNGDISSSVKTKNIVIPNKRCTKTSFVHVEIDNPYSTPRVYHNNLTNIVTITYSPHQTSDSFYTVIWQNTFVRHKNCRFNQHPKYRSDKKGSEDSSFAMDYFYSAMDRSYRGIDYDEEVENGEYEEIKEPGS